MIIKVVFEYDNDFDYVYCKNNIDIDIDDFHKWIYEDKTHPFWVYENGNALGVDYRGEAISYWINKFKNNESYILKSFTTEEIKNDLLIKL